MKKHKTLILITSLVLSATLQIHAREGRHVQTKKSIGNSYYLTDSAHKNYYVVLRNGKSGGIDRLPREGFVAGATLTMTKGDGQVVKRSQHGGSHLSKATFEPLTVRVKDSAGKPLVNVRVLFQSDEATCIPNPAVQITPGGEKLLYVMTDEHGDATLGIMPNGIPNTSDPRFKMGQSINAYYEDGPFTIIASFGDAKVLFHLVVGGS